MPETEVAFRSVDRWIRGKMPEAPMSLIEPTRAMVSEAMRLVRKGSVDSVDRQSVVVMDPVTQQHFTIMDTSVEMVDGRVVSTHGESGGLFVYSATFNDKNKLEVNTKDGIQAPRHPDAVSPHSIYLLRGIYPDAMQRVAESLKRAEVVKLPTPQS